jgi:hypothetical protein
MILIELLKQTYIFFNDFIKDSIKWRYPSPQRGIKNQGLNELQIYPEGKNFYSTIKKSCFNEFKKTGISRGIKISSLGTCFAEEISKRLNSNRLIVNYLSKEKNIYNFSANWGRIYTLPNLFQILKYSLTDDVKIEIEKDQGRFIDPYREHSVNAYNSANEARKFIKTHRKYSKEALKEAECIVITLGQNEAWYDKYKKIYRGSAPSIQLRKEFPNRFYVKELTYNQNKAFLISSINLLRKNNPALKIILTISPVPCFASFLSENIISQGFSGKAILRSVTHQVCKEMEDVIYFPSFEMVLCENRNSYLFDNRHIKQKRINKIFGLLKDVIDRG